MAGLLNKIADAKENYADSYMGGEYGQWYYSILVSAEADIIMKLSQDGVISRFDILKIFIRNAQLKINEIKGVANGEIKLQNEDGALNLAELETVAIRVRANEKKFKVDLMNLVGELVKDMGLSGTDYHSEIALFNNHIQSISPQAAATVAENSITRIHSVALLTNAVEPTLASSPGPAALKTFCTAIAQDMAAEFSLAEHDVTKLDTSKYMTIVRDAVTARVKNAIDLAKDLERGKIYGEGNPQLAAVGKALRPDNGRAFVHSALNHFNGRFTELTSAGATTR